jgi:hypothetical protein
VYQESTNCPKNLWTAYSEHNTRKNLQIKELSDELKLDTEQGKDGLRTSLQNRLHIPI